MNLDLIYLHKAEENLAAAASEFESRRFNSCASRCYYACFQAAIYALTRAGIRPTGRSGEWGHDFVQSQFIGQLINRRKIYPTSLRSTLLEIYMLREVADYKTDLVTEGKARRALRRSYDFLDAVRAGGAQP